MKTLLALLLCCHAWANGPAWVASLSETAPKHLDKITAHVAPGMHAAIGVYDTDAVEVEDTPGVKATVRVQWFEHRTVFAGMPEERQSAIPYYLPEPKDCAPTGAWVVELEPSGVGVYQVRIKCNANTVQVMLVCMALPPSDIGYGFYTDYVRFPDAKRGPDYYRDMAAHGMNTLTPYARELPGEFGVDNKDASALLAWHVDTALDVGLCDTRFPLLCLSVDAPNILHARRQARNDKWPDLIAYNCDEPGRERAAEVKASADAAHAGGLLSGTAIDGAIAQDIGDPLDVWVIHMDSMSWSAMNAAQDRGKQRWLYNCALRGSNAALHRYWTGLYTWAVNPRVCLTWTYAHDPQSRIKPDGAWDLRRVYDTATCDRDGKPLPTVALEGMAEGIMDSRLLQELERVGSRDAQAYLGKLRASVPLTFWPLGRNREYGPYVWDVPDTAVPPVDLCGMRAEVLRLLAVAR
jgi:hypothetical protein